VQPIHTPNNLDCWKVSSKIVLVGFAMARRIATVFLGLQSDGLFSNPRRYPLPAGRGHPQLTG
jgi:hypothetical protein